jgi:hypothetical protein
MYEENQPPDVEDIKIRLGNQIPVDEEPPAVKAQMEPADLANEFRNLGRQLGDTMRSAWNSEERQRFEAELREGVKTFAHEVEKAVQEIKDGQASQKAREEVSELKTRVESGEIADKTRTTLAQGLQWLSNELSKLADQFTPQEKQPPSEG